MRVLSKEEDEYCDNPERWWLRNEVLAFELPADCGGGDAKKLGCFGLALYGSHFCLVAM